MYRFCDLPKHGIITKYSCHIHSEVWCALISVILNEVWKEVESVCLNTEELLAEVKMVNDQCTTENIVVGSADVKALYPSLDVPFTVDKVCEVFHTSGVKVAGVDHEEL